jgi:hypothetical protein
MAGGLKIPLVAEHQRALREFRSVLLGREHVAVVVPEHQFVLQTAELCGHDRLMQRRECATDPRKGVAEREAFLASTAVGIIMVQV